MMYACSHLLLITHGCCIFRYHVLCLIDVQNPLALLQMSVILSVREQLFEAGADSAELYGLWCCQHLSSVPLFLTV
jgi:hypothetical protein